MARGFDQLVGRTIAGKFLVEAHIGSGAMGAVYRARQVALDKTIAIKVLHSENADEPTFAARFQREAKAASRLNHPNSMQVIDFGQEPDGLLYIAMEFLDGRSLHRVLREDGPLSPLRVADILMQTLAALAVAHDMGVVHRDLKPENIVVLQAADDDGRRRDLVKVCDFGIAKITDSRAYSGAGERESAAPVTTAGLLVGTPEYMSPEQGRGEKLDARSDLYSVGVILFEMLCGRVPFQAENAIGVVLKHITEEPARPSTLSPRADPRLEAVCLRALRKQAEDRYQSAREMRVDVRHVMGEAAAQPSAPAPPVIQVRLAEPATGNAATVQLRAVEPQNGEQHVARADDAAPKMTLVGTSAPIPRRSGRITTVAVIATLTGAAVAATTLGILARSARIAQGAHPASSIAAAPDTTISSLEGDGGEDDVPPLQPGPAGSAAPRSGMHGGHGLVPPAASGKTAASASPVASTPGTATTPAAAASTASTPPAGPAASAATTSPDPDFDPARAYVEVGLVNAQGVREPAVRAALRNVGLASCYRAALKTHGSRAIGVATLDLSIDENGATRSAIVAGAGFLPGLARCVQGAASAASLPKSQVDQGGGTAEINLAFKAP